MLSLTCCTIGHIMSGFADDSRSHVMSFHRPRLSSLLSCFWRSEFLGVRTGLQARAPSDIPEYCSKRSENGSEVFEQPCFTPRVISWWEEQAYQNYSQRCSIELQNALPKLLSNQRLCLGRCATKLRISTGLLLGAFLASVRHMISGELIYKHRLSCA